MHWGLKSRNLSNLHQKAQLRHPLQNPQDAATTRIFERRKMEIEKKRQKQSALTPETRVKAEKGFQVEPEGITPIPSATSKNSVKIRADIAAPSGTPRSFGHRREFLVGFGYIGTGTAIFTTTCRCLGGRAAGVEEHRQRAKTAEECNFISHTFLKLML
jgi:hypothetical protein